MLSLLTLSLVGCKKDNCTKVTGSQVTNQIAETGFTGVFVSGTANLFLSQGAASASITAPSEVAADLNASVSNGVLMLSFAQDCYETNDSVNLYITAPIFSEITHTGSGFISSDLPLSGTDLNLQITGAGTGNLELDYTDIETRIEGEGVDLSLAGQVETHNIVISGEGQMQSFDLLSVNTIVTVAGEADPVEVFASSNLDVQISGNSVVYYKGSPSISQNISGTGQVINAN